jgi:hypothetical protein
MERLTIDGGEVWLGFARNRVKAFRRAGIRYTRQVFEMPDGAKVIVELAGRNHAIRLVGGSVGSIISGIVRGGEIIELPVPQGSPPNTKPKKVLRSFKATADAAKKVLKKPEMATKFGDLENLTTPISGQRSFQNPRGNSAQSGVLQASMYTGLMKKVIQILLGRKDKVEITYTYDFFVSYGVYKSDGGSFWLISISKEHGVLAMPLELSTAGKGSGAPKADKESFKVFGGVPTGKDFPIDIETAITNKKVIRLATNQQIAEFYELMPYFFECGWSFSLKGDEAHNTGHKLVDGKRHSFYYKLLIDINTERKEGSARLIKVESSLLWCAWVEYGDSIGSLSNFRGVEAGNISFLHQKPLSFFGKVYDYGDVLQDYIDSGIQVDLSGTTTSLAQFYLDSAQALRDFFSEYASQTETPPPVTVYVGHREDGKLFTLGYGGMTGVEHSQFTRTNCPPGFGFSPPVLIPRTWPTIDGVAQKPLLPKIPPLTQTNDYVGHTTQGVVTRYQVYSWYPDPFEERPVPWGVTVAMHAVETFAVWDDRPKVTPVYCAVLEGVRDGYSLIARSHKASWLIRTVTTDVTYTPEYTSVYDPSYRANVTRTRLVQNVQTSSQLSEQKYVAEPPTVKAEPSYIKDQLARLFDVRKNDSLTPAVGVSCFGSTQSSWCLVKFVGGVTSPFGGGEIEDEYRFFYNFVGYID